MTKKNVEIKPNNTFLNFLKMIKRFRIQHCSYLYIRKEPYCGKSVYIIMTNHCSDTEDEFHQVKQHQEQVFQGEWNQQ